MMTMPKLSRAPAIPTIQVIRTNSSTPKMFWIHGKYTPSTVPRSGAWSGHWSVPQASRRLDRGGSGQYRRLVEDWIEGAVVSTAG
ncbi:hypothetical protein ElyMa_007043500 [Elysia marginata]|uniref:Spondin domain-containing protein n=1 Tax=Elysia marginata TaxID=1093978 RepID=A0AAV4JVT2_9GAST|nr:hypothetical protein ElyMa_007043500 [Elysia marginata]